MRFIQAVILLIYLHAVGLFASQNQETIGHRFLHHWSISAPAAIMIVSAHPLGMLGGWTVVSFLRRSIRTVGESPRS